MKVARRLATLLIVVTSVVVAVPRAASAHDGEGVVTVETAEAEGTSVNYVVRLTWANDGHAALDATLTATVLGPNGPTGAAPVQLSPVDQEGRYEGTVEFPDPGNWTVRFVAIEPETRFDRAQPVTAPVTTTAAPTTTEPETTTTTAEPDDEADETAAAQDSADTDDGGSPLVPILLGVIVLAAVAGGVVYTRRTRPT